VTHEKAGMRRTAAVAIANVAAVIAAVCAVFIISRAAGAQGGRVVPGLVCILMAHGPHERQSRH
jgi:hypothetical protein